MMGRIKLKLLGPLATAGVLLMAAGCASSGPTPPSPATSLSGSTGNTPLLAFDKVYADLGTVPFDRETSETFVAMNRGQGSLQLGQIKVQVDQGCEAVEVPQENPPVESGKGVLLPIHFGPHRQAGPHRISISVPTSGPAKSATLSVRFNVSNGQVQTATGPRLQVDKKRVDIGKVPLDWPLFEQFTLSNVGTEQLVLAQESPPVRVEKGC